MPRACRPPSHTPPAVYRRLALPLAVVRYLVITPLHTPLARVRYLVITPLCIPLARVQPPMKRLLPTQHPPNSYPTPTTHHPHPTCHPPPTPPLPLPRCVVSMKRLRCYSRLEDYYAKGAATLQVQLRTAQVWATGLGCARLGELFP